MTDLDSLFRAERGYEESPPEGAEERVLAGVMGVVGGGGGGGDGGGGAPKPGMALPRAIGGMIATGLVGLVAGGMIVRATSEPRVVVVEKPVQVVVSAAPAASTEPPPREIEIVNAPPASISAPEAIDARGLAAERTLLDAARVAFARGDADAALDALGRHAREFPNGRLTEEREALAVRALAKAGRMPEAKARGEKFLRAYPRSLSASAVRAAIEASP
jgi:hypothetical protein